MTGDEISQFNELNISHLKDKMVIYELDFKKNIKLFSEKVESKIRFGVCVKRCDIRGVPKESDEKWGEEPPLDYMQYSAMLVNEPLLILCSDIKNEWYYVRTYFAEGWSRCANIAVCTYEQWLEIKDMKKFLTVTDDVLTLQFDAKRPEVSRIQLTMGTKLKLSDDQTGKVGYRYVGDNFKVKFPINKNGKLDYEEVLIPKGAGVHEGNLPYTSYNILKLATKTIGNLYGWGGKYEARDCSALVMEIFRCFGFLLPRDVSGLMQMCCETIELADCDVKVKDKMIGALSPGSLIMFPGHVCIYVGRESGENIVISAVETYYEKDETILKPVRVDSVLESGLNLLRKNGETWLDAVTDIKIIDRFF